MKYTRFQDIPKFIDRGSYAVDYPMEGLVKWLAREEDEQGLQLNPDFQRGHVWTETQQRAYIEFLLHGGNSGRDFYFNCPSWHNSVPEGSYDDYVCVDGLQRITAIRKFVNNELKVFGSYFLEYTDKLRITQNTLRVNINDLKSKKEVLRWYIEMNAGGTPHSKAEIKRIQDMMEAEN